jgi:hypothetical protein
MARKTKASIEAARHQRTWDAYSAATAQPIDSDVFYVATSASANARDTLGRGKDHTPEYADILRASIIDQLSSRSANPVTVAFFAKYGIEA